MLFRNRLSAARSVLRMAVDPISNTIAITSANPAYPPRRPGTVSRSIGRWGQALSEGVLREDLVWPILHEITHHSSLQTPVGMSLAALSVSHTSSAGSLSLDADCLQGAARDSVRLAAVSPLLRPLLEGMALFAEFDATSGSVPLASWSFMVANRLFYYPECRDAVFAGRDVLSHLKIRLEALRLTPAVIARKRDLLGRDLLDPGGYLLGYLLIKMIWGDLAMRNRLWENSDLFVMFVQDYFFSDHALAFLLVQSPDRPLDEELANLSIYLHNRVVALVQNSGEFGRQFAMHYLVSPLFVPEYRNAEMFDDDILRDRWAIRTVRNMHWHTPDFVFGRTIPRVLAAPATVGIDRTGKFEARFLDGNSPMEGPALNASRPLEGGPVEADGSVECVVLLPQNERKNMRLLLCVFLDKELVATLDPETNRFNDSDDVQACDRLGSYLAIESFAEQVEAERWAPEGSALAQMLDKYSAEAGTRRMIDLWAPFALAVDPDLEERPAALSSLETGGFKKALDLDEQALQVLVETSLRPLGSTLAFGGTGPSAEPGMLLNSVNDRSRSILGFRVSETREGKLRPSRV